MIFLVAFAALVCWCVWVYFCPFTDCPRCKGGGRNVARRRKYYGRCRSRRCKSGTIQRFGSKAVHRTFRGALEASRRRRDR